MVWCSPERHGAMTGIMKTQIDWIPLSLGAVRPTQGKTLAVMQVNGGSQSFNAVNQLRILGRWMRLLTIPNQSSTPKAFLEFDENDRMKPSPTTTEWWMSWKSWLSSRCLRGAALTIWWSVIASVKKRAKR